MDVHKIYKNYETIEKYLFNLDTFKIETLEQFEDQFNDYLAISMSLFTILNACIEIGEGLIEEKNLEFPSTYKKVFEILGNNKIIDKKLAKKLSNHMKERNMIAHQYDDINKEDIYNLFLQKEIFSDFISQTKKLWK